MTKNMFVEELIGAGAMVVSGLGYIVAQVTPAVPNLPDLNITELVFQFGGLGLAVWLVIRHTTVTIPSLEERYRKERETLLDQHKTEREASLKLFKDELDMKRQEYMQAIKELTKEYSDELAHRRGEILEALKRSECRWNRNGS